jgi:phage terminase small subunit
MGKLTHKQQRFIAEYLVDLNATQAAIRAGYSKKTAYSIGDETLKKPEVAMAVKAAFEKLAQRTEINQDYVLHSIVSTIERCKAPTGFSPAAVMKGSELLGKHLGMFKERFELSGNITIRHEDALDALR